MAVQTVRDSNGLFILWLSRPFSFSLSLSLSVSVSLCLYLCLCLPVCLSFCLSVFLSPYLCFCLWVFFVVFFFCASVSLYLCLSSLSVCLPPPPPPYLLLYFLSSLPPPPLSLLLSICLVWSVWFNGVYIPFASFCQYYICLCARWTSEDRLED